MGRRRGRDLDDESDRLRHQRPGRAGRHDRWRALPFFSCRFRRQYKGLPLPTYSWLHTGDDFVLQDCNDAAEANTEGNLADWLGSRASERFADHPEVLADLNACLMEQRTIRRETQHRYHSTGEVRQLAFSYVFVPPRTVMVHREDISVAKPTDRQREAMAQSDNLVARIRPEHDGQPADLSRSAREAA